MTAIWRIAAVSTPFPGQAGNLVGHTRTPTSAPARWPGGTWPGSWPGSFTGGGPTTTGAYATANPTIWTNGTPGNPKIISFVDFDASSGPNAISIDGTDHNSYAFGIHDVTFVGCRFQSCAIASEFNVECWKTGSSNIAFYYCSMTPRRTAGPFFSKVNSPAVLDVSNPGRGHLRALALASRMAVAAYLLLVTEPMAGHIKHRILAAPRPRLPSVLRWERI